MALEILLLVLQGLGFQAEFVAPETGFFGGFNGTHWDGMVGLLHRNEADISIPVLTDTPERRNAIDFSTAPVFWVRMSFLINAPNFLPIQGIWMPFKKEVWIGFFVLFLLVIGVTLNVARLLLTKRTLGDNIIRYSYGILFDKKSKFLWRSDSLRIILGMWNLSARIGTVYFAMVFVRNCMPHMISSVPFNNVEGLGRAVSRHGYRFITRSLHDSHIENIMAQYVKEGASHRELR